MPPVLRWDGHTHTQFCRHGSPDDLAQYLDRAVALQFERYSVTEHPPLPPGWVKDERIFRELAMDEADIDDYFRHARALKAQYEGRLDVRVGLELDYLYGAESFSENMLALYQNFIEDLVVSLHFLPGQGGMRCLDVSAADFCHGILDYYGSMERVIEVYFDHIERAVRFAATLPVPARIGHLNLILKFQKVLPDIDRALVDRRLQKVFTLLSATGVGVDVNTAGLRKADCAEVYVPEWFVKQCLRAGVTCVFGSDAHNPADVGAGWAWFERIASSHSVTRLD